MVNNIETFFPKLTISQLVYDRSVIQKTNLTQLYTRPTFSGLIFAIVSRCATPETLLLRCFARVAAFLKRPLTLKFSRLNASGPQGSRSDRFRYIDSRPPRALCPCKKKNVNSAFLFRKHFLFLILPMNQSGI